MNILVYKKSKNLEEDIIKARPTLKMNTVRQYVVLLERLQRLFKADYYDFLEDSDKLMEKIKDLHYLTQRNMLNAIIVLLMALNHDKTYDVLLETYGKLRDGFNEKYDDEQKTGVVSDKQAPNFATSEEIFDMLKKMKEQLKNVSNEPNKKEKQLLQAYTLFSIYSRMPMRNDVAGMRGIGKREYNKLSVEDKKDNNYLVVEKSKLFFVLNNYKTSRKYEELNLEIEDKELKRILRRYIKVNGMGILFKTSTGKPITRTELSKILLKYSDSYMGKKISTTLLRKIYLSSKYGQDGGLKEQFEELEKDNKVMAHSKEVALNTYVKKAQN